MSVQADFSLKSLLCSFSTTVQVVKYLTLMLTTPLCIEKFLWNQLYTIRLQLGIRWSNNKQCSSQISRRMQPKRFGAHAWMHLKAGSCHTYRHCLGTQCILQKQKSSRVGRGIHCLLMTWPLFSLNKLLQPNHLMKAFQSTDLERQFRSRRWRLTYIIVQNTQTPTKTHMP